MNEHFAALSCSWMTLPTSIHHRPVEAIRLPKTENNIGAPHNRMLLLQGINISKPLQPPPPLLITHHRRISAVSSTHPPVIFRFSLANSALWFKAQRLHLTIRKIRKNCNKLQTNINTEDILVNLLSQSQCTTWEAKYWVMEDTASEDPNISRPIEHSLLGENTVTVSLQSRC